MKQASAITLSHDGRVIVPAALKKRFKGGEVFVAVKENDKLILEEVEKVDEQFLEDLEFARRTNEAWERYENGEFQSLPMDEFLQEIKKW